MKSNISLKSKLMNFQVALVAAFTYASLSAYGYKDGDWLHRATAGATGIFVRVIAVGGVNKLYAFIASYTDTLHFVPATLLKSTDYKTNYFTTGFGMPTDFVTNVFEESVPAGYTIDADRKVTAISVGVAPTANDIPQQTLATQIPTSGDMRVPTTAGVVVFNGFSNATTALAGKTKVALAGEVPTSIVKVGSNDTPEAEKNWWQKLSSGWKTAIYIGGAVIVVILILKFLPRPN